MVEFDFLGKDSVRYWNFVPVEKKVRLENLAEFQSTRTSSPNRNEFIQFIYCFVFYVIFLFVCCCCCFLTFNTLSHCETSICSFPNPN